VESLPSQWCCVDAEGNGPQVDEGGEQDAAIGHAREHDANWDLTNGLRTPWQVDTDLQGDDDFSMVTSSGVLV
jgi:hypothetical protein